MPFTSESLEQMRLELGSIPAKTQQLTELFSIQRFNNPKSAEFAQQGFLRRVQILKRCIENVYSFLPPDNIGLPTKDVRLDTEINIHASVLSVFACLDNLAWTWVIEKNITDKAGAPLRQTRVGLRAKNTIVRSSFPAELQSYLKGLDEWLIYLENFRHALAHRIPLYIPPYIVSSKDEEAYRVLEIKRQTALAQLETEDYERLTAEQDRLKFFKPWMQYSFIEGSKPVVFHPQLLADFNTIHELSLKVLVELDR